MIKKTVFLIIAVCFCFSPVQAKEPVKTDTDKYCKIIKKYLYTDYKATWRNPGGKLKYPYLIPGSNTYQGQLWDWDSWLCDIAMQQIVSDIGNEKDKAELMEHGKGCLLNFLSLAGLDGWLPGMMTEAGSDKPEFIYKNNPGKPIYAEHAAFITQLQGGNAEWIREDFEKLQAHITKCYNHHRDKATGLYHWFNDIGVGIDNDPTVFFRPENSSGNIYYNSLMYKELQSMSYLATCLGFKDLSVYYLGLAKELKDAMNKHCWDPRDGNFYSVDLDLLPVTEKPTWGGSFIIHSFYPRDYDCLIMRIEYWACFMPMWNGIASKEQAARMVQHITDTSTFSCLAGIRSLSKMEKMYDVRASGNPSNWRGPVWIISNYMVFKGLLNYGYEKEARELAEKTIAILGKDIEKSGAMHEYYDPETGLPLLNKGFQNWNFLVANMIAWYEGRPCIKEF